MIAISHVHMDGGPTGSASTDDPGDPGGDGRDRDTDCEQHEDRRDDEPPGYIMQVGELEGGE